MKVETFGYVIALIVVMGIVSELVCYLRPVRAVLSGTNAVVPPFIAVVAVIFGLFAAANASDIWGRSRALRLTTEREVTTARSIVKFTEKSVTRLIFSVVRSMTIWTRQRPSSAAGWRREKASSSRRRVQQTP